MLAWLDFLKAQEQVLGKETVDKWLRPLSVVHFDSGNLYLEAKGSFELSWFEEHIRPNLKNHLVNNNHRPIKVHITSPEHGQPRSKQEQKSKQAYPTPPTLVLTPDPLDPTATLDTFVSGESNTLLFQFFNELVEKKIALGAFNPVYLHGSSGTGKTHLLMALAQAFNKLGLKALYVRAETFTEHVVSAIRSSEMQTFRKSYRNADILLVDDIHIFARRSATQEEFFHTFNTLHTSGKQLIISSTILPSLLEEIEPRLVSRFEWGILLHLEKLKKEELKQVIQNRCIALDVPLADDVIQFLIETFPPHPPTLNRALEALILRSHMNKQTDAHAITPQIAAQFLSQLIEAEKKSALTPEKIVMCVASFYGIKVEDVLGKSQTQECVLPRQIAMYLCRNQLDLSFMKIGSVFSRDHSTVMTSVKHIKAKLDAKDPELHLVLAEIHKRF